MENNDSGLVLPPAIEDLRSPPQLHRDVLLEVSVIGSAGVRGESCQRVTAAGC